MLGVASVLMGMLLPVLSTVRENAHRIICASNQRQFGMAVHMYARDYRDRMPDSYLQRERNAVSEMMNAHLSDPDQWDGLGLLFAGHYCRSKECFYCPSHRGEHSADAYNWEFPRGRTITTNYHYGGSQDWGNPTVVRRLDGGERLVLATDGFRTLLDINHVDGTNVLRGDGSVRWRSDVGGESLSAMVRKAAETGDYTDIIKRLESD